MTKSKKKNAITNHLVGANWSQRQNTLVKHQLLSLLDLHHRRCTEQSHVLCFANKEASH